MESDPNTSRSVSVHSTPTRVLGAAAFAFCAFFSVNLLMTGTPASIWRFLPWLLLAGWGIVALLWRPRLLVRANGLSVRNILRDHEIPFSELTALRVMQNVSFETTAGRIPSWGAPGTGKLGPKMRTGPGGIRTLAALPRTQAEVQAAWDAWGRGPASQPGPAKAVASSWNVPTAVVGVLLLSLAVASALT